MQLHELKPKNKRERKKRVGRGGKRGTYSGRGTKGQKARAGTRIRPGFRGGDNPIWKLFPKQRGASKKVDIKHAKFQVRYSKPEIVDLNKLSAKFEDGEAVSLNSLLEKGLISDRSRGVKILGDGELTKKLSFSGVNFSKSAKDKILKSGGKIK